MSSFIEYFGNIPLGFRTSANCPKPLDQRSEFVSFLEGIPFSDREANLFLDDKLWEEVGWFPYRSADDVPLLSSRFFPFSAESGGIVIGFFFSFYYCYHNLVPICMQISFFNKNSNSPDDSLQVWRLTGPEELQGRDSLRGGRCRFLFLVRRRRSLRSPRG